MQCKGWLRYQINIARERLSKQEGVPEEVTKDAAQMNKALETMKEKLRDKEARNKNVIYIYMKF